MLSISWEPRNLDKSNYILYPALYSYSICIYSNRLMSAGDIGWQLMTVMLLSPPVISQHAILSGWGWDGQPWCHPVRPGDIVDGRPGMAIRWDGWQCCSHPCSWSFLMTLNMSVPDVEWLYVSFSLEPSHAFASLPVNHCCLELTATGAGVSPKFLISAPSSVQGRVPRVRLACR
jgi:hypothetical protein